ncbi:hypothetical protein P7L53_16390 [Thermoleptolyngbya sichuanensis XZ-Cy5]|uniref:hypothetical protein n=1 Tax=Thermoleptolyngbya sichuanensis TaxID=2885951 RepID=UPI00240DEE77|nr:hypothetical protein [Thermoleptolyngbya sichuanensis]MDG2617820.1 hypothetical protein [Thermoleptolyngbya sichuanensis XZ-Cy5]
MVNSRRTQRQSRPLVRWLDRAMALVVLLNLLLVLVDTSYIPLRDYYLRFFPQFTAWYGETYKGIEPHRVTEGYLEQAAKLWDADLGSPESEALLRNLRDRSDELIDENPFNLAGKTGQLERLKHRMRRFVGTDSSRQAFRTFWSRAYLEQIGEDRAIAFFDREIEPLLQRNYYRGVDENGRPIDRFWRIDLWFMGLFAVDLGLRLWHLYHRYRRTNWFDVILWRWYDLLLFLPIWRWLRVIPTVVRLDQSGLLPMRSLQSRVSLAIASYFAVQLTEVVVLRVIEQAQDFLRQGGLTKLLLNPDTRMRYVDVTGVNEVEEIARQITHLTVHQVLPALRPDIEALLHYTLISVLEQSPVYRGLSRMPGINALPHQMSERLVSNATQTAYGSLVTALDDSKGLELTRNLVDRAGKTLRQQLREDDTSRELENLLADLLEEIKISYVRQISEQDIEALRDNNRHLYEIAQAGFLPPDLEYSSEKSDA